MYEVPKPVLKYCDTCEAPSRDMCICNECPFCDEPCPNEDCVYKETKDGKDM